MRQNYGDRHLAPMRCDCVAERIGLGCRSGNLVHRNLADRFAGLCPSRLPGRRCKLAGRGDGQPFATCHLHQRLGLRGLPSGCDFTTKPWHPGGFDHPILAGCAWNLGFVFRSNGRQFVWQCGCDSLAHRTVVFCQPCWAKYLETRRKEAFNGRSRWCWLSSS